MNDITRKILDWYEENKRELPWRETDDPYKIWLSEVILQQTRVNQGLKYYLDFMGTWPEVIDLANAEEEVVMKHWQGLGYYTRARNLLKTARIIAGELDGKFPDTYEGLLKLPGIGPYTAAAIASIAFNRVEEVVDGNVERVVSRLFAITDEAGGRASQRRIRDVLEQMIDQEDPGTFNQAIMEFGALQCVPARPDCPACPLKDVCLAHETDSVAKIPVTRQRTKVKERFFNYLVMMKSDINGKFIALKKRDGEDIWKSLYDFPLIETATAMPVGKLMDSEDWRHLEGGYLQELREVSKTYRHLLTHRKIMARFLIMDVKTYPGFMEKPPYYIIPVEQFHQFPTSRLVEQFYNDYNPSGC